MERDGKLGLLTGLALVLLIALLFRTDSEQAIPGGARAVADGPLPTIPAPPPPPSFAPAPAPTPPPSSDIAPPPPSPTDLPPPAFDNSLPPALPSIPDAPK